MKAIQTTIGNFLDSYFTEYMVLAVMWLCIAVFAVAVIMFPVVRVVFFIGLGIKLLTS